MTELYHGDINTKTVWTPASHGGVYTHHRIPGIVITKKGTVIIYCEARDTTDTLGTLGKGSDWCRMDILLQRSEDGGETFGAPIYITRGGCAEDGNSNHITVNNPVMIVGDDGILHMLFCKSYGICNGGLWYTQSTDDGISWSTPRQIMDSLKAEAGYDFNCFAFGPTHGICTSKGVLMTAAWAVPCEDGRELFSHVPSHAHIVYSTDNGETWRITKKISSNTNETDVAELADGSIIINSRTGMGVRALNVCRSFTTDREPQWWGTAYPDELVDPGCCGGMVSFNNKDISVLLTVNCDDAKYRRYITVKCSFDGGITYPKKLRITENYGGYCDIAVDARGKVYVLWETAMGVMMSLTTFSLADELLA